MGCCLLFLGGIATFAAWAVFAMSDDGFVGGSTGIYVTQVALGIIPALCLASGLLVAAGVAFHLYADNQEVRLQLHDELLEEDGFEEPSTDA